MLQAYTTVLTESALTQAKRATEEITGGEHRGPLHGVPVAVKDLCFTKDVATTAGTRI